MQYRTLGRTGLSVSTIGFGTWGLGGTWGAADDEAGVAALRLAMDRGVNFIDTAYVYGDGHSEEVIGRAITGRRDQVILASKVPPKNGKWPALPGVPSREAFPADWVIACTERSLKKLGTDCLEVQQLHLWDESWLHETDWLEGLETLKRQGKIRYFGVSVGSWTPYDSVSLIESDLIDTVQVIYSLFEQRPAERLLPAAAKHDVGIIVRVPFEEGLLTGTLAAGHRFEQGDWRADFLTPARLTEAQPHIDAAKAQVQAPWGDLPSLALAFTLAHPAVSTVIPGMRKARHVEANVAAGDLPALPAAKLDSLKKLAWVHGWKYPWSSDLGETAQSVDE